MTLVAGVAHSPMDIARFFSLIVLQLRDLKRLHKGTMFNR